MKFFAVVPALLAAVAAEAQLPIAPQFLGQAGLYRGYSAYGAVPALPYAAAFSAPANFAYGAQQITALNAEAVPAPVIAKAAPIAASHSSQYQAQDEDKNFSFGYSNINSAKQETGNAYGGVTGSYTYTDEAGVHTVNYVADHLGFRVNSDNLPVAPTHLAVAPVHIAEPVMDPPAVVEAKAAFFKAYNAAKSGVVKRSAQNILPQTYAGLPALDYAGYQPYSAPLAYNGFSHLNYAAAYAAAPAVAAPTIAAPLAYAGAPAREATLTTIKLNPGHATFYR